MTGTYSTRGPADPPPEPDTPRSHTGTPTVLAAQGGHRETVGRLSPEEQRAFFVAGHLVCGVTTMISGLLGGYNDLAGLAGGGQELPPPVRMLGLAAGVTEIVFRTTAYATALVDEPLAIRDESFAVMRHLLSVTGIVSKAGFTIGAAMTRGAPPGSGLPLPLLDACADGAIALVMLVPTIGTLVEAGQSPDSPERTLALYDRSSRLCRDVAAVVRAGDKLGENPEATAFLLPFRVVLVEAAGMLQLAEAWLAIE